MLAKDAALTPKRPSLSVSSSECSGDLCQSQVIGEFQALVGGELHS